MKTKVYLVNNFDLMRMPNKLFHKFLGESFANYHQLKQTMQWLEALVENDKLAVVEEDGEAVALIQCYCGTWYTIGARDAVEVKKIECTPLPIW